MSSVEEAMNRVWNVRASRGWFGRFARYTPFLLLLFLAVLLTAVVLFRLHGVLMAWGFGGARAFPVPGGALLFGALGLLFFLWVVMVLMIRLLPNTRVRLTSALLGATVAIVPLYFFSRILLLFPALFLARNQLFYGSLAAFPVALLLVYLFWACALFGCAVAFVRNRLRNEPDHDFFVRGAGFREDWATALRDTEALYSRVADPTPGPGSGAAPP
jgi:membrane protein